MILGGIGAGLLLRRSWRARPGEGGRFTALGWAVIVATILAPAFAIGATRGPFLGLTLLSVGALVVVATGMTIRPAKAGREGRDSLAPEPSERTTTWWRQTLRWLLAGPIGMIAAMGIGIAWAVWVPGEPHTRLLIGGLLVPVLWGGAMAWTLADDRILRATAVLVGTAILGFGLSILRGFA